MTDDATASVPPTKRRGLSPTMIGVLVVAAIVAFCAFGGGSDGDSEPSTYEAGKQCERFLEDRLKSPSTADFNLTTTGGPSSFSSTGTVDSENGFGAMVRSSVSCELSLDGDTWHLDDWTIVGR